MNQTTAMKIAQKLIDSIITMIAASGGQPAALNIGIHKEQDKYTVCAGFALDDGSRPFAIAVNADLNVQSVFNSIVLKEDTPIIKLYNDGKCDRLIVGRYVTRLSGSVEIEIVSDLEIA